jgi:Fic family protein
VTDPVPQLLFSIRAQIDALEGQVAAQRGEMDAMAHERRRHLALLERALRDGRIRGEPLRALLLLDSELSFTEARPVKLLWMTSALGIRKGTASKALRKLVDLGYLTAAKPTDRRALYQLEERTSQRQ